MKDFNDFFLSKYWADIETCFLVPDTEIPEMVQQALGIELITINGLPEAAFLFFVFTKESLHIY